MTLHIDCGPYRISVIGGPDDDPVSKDPVVELMELFRTMLDDLGGDEFSDLPSMHVHGDGITTFEVASVRIGPPMQAVVLDEFKPWLLADPMTNEQYKIYGHVPAMTIMSFIIKHDGDTRPLRELIIKNQRAFAEETRRVENLDLGDES